MEGPSCRRRPSQRSPRGRGSGDAAGVPARCSGSPRELGPAVSTAPRTAAPDGRFAPSPTGPLHLGSLRTALAAWLFARSQSARFLLRVEDLDPQRSRAEWEASQLADLRALGLDWDGEVVRQSERFAQYDAALARLDAEGHLYPCFCTRAEIREAASAPHGDLPEGAYPGTCGELSAAERRTRIAAGERYALRVRAAGARVAFTDRIAGPHDGIVDDFVVRRADGIPAYQLAVVVDDAAQGIGEVVRGADLLDSTPRQIWLGRRLGLPIPALRPRRTRPRRRWRAAGQTPPGCDARGAQRAADPDARRARPHPRAGRGADGHTGSGRTALRLPSAGSVPDRGPHRLISGSSTHRDRIDRP